MPKLDFRIRAHWALRKAAINLMFRFLLPLLVRLPRPIGFVGARWLGDLSLLLDIDWRTVAVREHFVADRTMQALRELRPEASISDLKNLLRERFRNAAREELEGHGFPLGIAPSVNCAFENLEPVEACLAQGRGMVLLTLHFDATLTGVVQLGRKGLRLNLMTSNIVEDARVPHAVQNYFKRKYDGIQSYLNGGRSLHVETNLKAFYQGIRRGESAVVLCEGPAPNIDDAVNVHFLGRLRALAPGAFRIAEKTAAPMAAFVCLREGINQYRVVFSPVYFSAPDLGHSENIPALFGFLDDFIRRYPERWWAADLLPSFKNLD